MAFNHNGYTPERSQTLPNGIYEMIIRSASEKSNGSGNYIEVEVQARGKRGWTPNKIFFNEAPVVGSYKRNGNPITEEDLKRWNREMTTFFDCFGIEPGNFTCSSWVGKIGHCKVAEQYDPNEPDKKSKKFKAIYPQVPEAPEQPMPSASKTPVAPSATPAPVQTVQDMVNDFQPAPDSVTPPDFPEDIPF